MDYLPFTRPTIDEDTIASVVETLRSGWLATGPKVKRFEEALSEKLGGRIIKSFTSATGALEVALEAIGIGPGDEVIVPAMSFVASANVIVRVGARPVFVDVDLTSRNLDLDAVEAAITPNTRAIMPVHFAGLPVDMDRLYAIAHKHQLRVVEDAAHAIGSRWQGKLIGSFGDIVSFSFHPNKNMTTTEGGALSMTDAAEAARVDRLRFHGIEKFADGTQDVSVAGGKYNLTDVAAAVGLGQLARIDAFNERRRQLAHRYLAQLATDPGCLLPAAGDEGHSWHMMTVLLPLDALRITRHEFIQAMHQRGIGIGLHYQAMHLFSCYRAMGYGPGDFPNAERIGRETVTLPLFPAMADSDVDRVCEAMAQVLAAAKK